MICLAILYWSPNLSNILLNRLILDICEKDAKNITVIMGYTNLPVINWEEMSTTKNGDSKEFRFLKTARDAFLIHPIIESTRLIAGDNHSLLDIIITDVGLSDFKSMFKPPLGHSHYVIIEAELPISRVNIKSQTWCNFAEGDYDYKGRRKELLNIEIEYANDVNKVWKTCNNVKQMLQRSMYHY